SLNQPTSARTSAAAIGAASTSERERDRAPRTRGVRQFLYRHAPDPESGTLTLRLRKPAVRQRLLERPRQLPHQIQLIDEALQRRLSARVLRVRDRRAARVELEHRCPITVREHVATAVRLDLVCNGDELVCPLEHASTDAALMIHAE